MGGLIRLLVLAAVAVWVLSKCVSGGSPTAAALPEHIVTDRVSLRPMPGYRIRIDSYDAQLSPAGCRALAEHYAKEAKGGQVGVHKPVAAKFGRKHAPFCVDNFDGRGVQMSDLGLFEPATN